nr:O-antigen ligase family protein [Colwellia sp. E2M01]
MVDSPDSNGTAAAIASSLVFCLYYFWFTKNKLGKLCFVIAGGLITNGLILINSRGAFLAVFVSITLFLFSVYFSKINLRFKRTSVIFIILMGLLALSIIVDKTTIQRIQTMQNYEVNEGAESGATRTVFWKAAIDLSKDYPLGTGYKGFEYFAPFYIPENIHTGKSKNRAVHSTWFEVLSEVGYPGLIVFLLLIFSSINHLRKTIITLKGRGDIKGYFKVIAIRSSFIGFLVLMTFLNRARSEVLYWLILFSGIAYNLFVVQKATKND